MDAISRARSRPLEESHSILEEWCRQGFVKLECEFIVPVDIAPRSDAGDGHE